MIAPVILPVPLPIPLSVAFLDLSSDISSVPPSVPPTVVPHVSPQFDPDPSCSEYVMLMRNEENSSSVDIKAVSKIIVSLDIMEKEVEMVFKIDWIIELGFVLYQ